jgi:very-short-patch-repair endonuclease
VGDRYIDAYPEERLVIELDGAGSRLTAASPRDDRRRQNEIIVALAGWTPLRLTWEGVVDRWPSVERTLRRVL